MIDPERKTPKAEEQKGVKKKGSLRLQLLIRPVFDWTKKHEQALAKALALRLRHWVYLLERWVPSEEDIAFSADPNARPHWGHRLLLEEEEEGDEFSSAAAWQDDDDMRPPFSSSATTIVERNLQEDCADNNEKFKENSPVQGLDSCTAAVATFQQNNIEGGKSALEEFCTSKVFYDVASLYCKTTCSCTGDAGAAYKKENTDKAEPYVPNLPAGRTVYAFLKCETDLTPLKLTQMIVPTF